MTVSYTLQVATCTGVGCFWRLLFRWKGSTWKLLWPNLLAFVVLVIAVSVLHQLVLTEEQKTDFQKVARSCKRDKDMIPMAFILGFYVNLVITRWWEQYVKMPWPDGMALYISTLIYGQDDRGRLIRRTLIRYCNLALVLVLRLFSTRIMRRFPTYDHMVDAGLLLVNEKVIFEHVDQKTPHPKYWMPLVWAGGIMVRARKEGRVKDDFSLKTLVDALNTFRGECGGMIDYDWICIPLVYTQVVTLAVYTFIVTAVVGSQALKPAKEPFTMYVPLFSFMQLFFYMGWLKVAESLVNPWGDDDDDFEVNWMIDRHLQVSYMIVDEMHQEHPEMLKDQYWDDIFPTELPYTQASRQFNFRPTTSFHLGMDDLVTQRGTGSRYRQNTVDEDNSDSDGDGDGSESATGFESRSRPVKIASESQKLAKGSDKRSKNAYADKRFKSRATTSRMLYEADSNSLSSLTALFPSEPNVQPTGDDMFCMSDLSMYSEKEMPMREPENLDRRDSNSSVPHRSSFKRDILTDLKPVDLSAPDSDTSLHFESGGWWRPYYDGGTSDPTVSAENDTNQESPKHKAKVIVPTGEPITHTFGNVTPDNVSITSHESQKSEVSNRSILSETGEPRASLIDRHVKFIIPSPATPGAASEMTPSAASETTPSADSEMLTLLAPSAQQFDSTTDLAVTPTSSAGSTLPTNTLVTTSPPTGTNTTTTSSTGRRSVLSARVIDMLIGAPTFAGTTSATHHQPSGEEVAIAIDESADRISSPYVPSPAIPVPAVSQAHVASPAEPPSSEERDMMEAAMAARRGFHELEPISEQTEASAESMQRKREKEARKPPGGENADGAGPSSS